jgi:pimeloyl-ACP methyl ester carboxylesterase
MRISSVISGTAWKLLLAACTPPKPRHASEPTDALRTSVMVSPSLNLTVSVLTAKNPEGPLGTYVHGTPGEAAGWIDYVVEPVFGSRSKALHRPSFGKSLPDTSASSFAIQAAAVVALFPPGNGKIVLVGHSLGVAVVAEVATENPERVSALVLLASSLDPAQESIHLLQPIGQMWPVRGMLPHILRNANVELLAFKEELLLLKPTLRLIQASTVIVHGTGDNLVPFADVGFMKTHFTRAQSVKTQVLERINHFLPWNSEPSVRAAISWAIRPNCMES